MTPLVRRALEASGLSEVLAERRLGQVSAAHGVLLGEVDLLALGALADLVRREEVGDEVRIYVPPPALDDAGLFLLPHAGRDVTGLELLREVAIARVTGPRAARVRIDWGRCGLELAQVALGFGANELAGRLSTKVGAIIAEGDLMGVGKRSRLELATVAKKRELAGFVRRAERTPVFVLADGTQESPFEGQAMQEAL
jgi:hypothetical protein